MQGGKKKKKKKKKPRCLLFLPAVKLLSKAGYLRFVFVRLYVWLYVDRYGCMYVCRSVRCAPEYLLQ